jgi:hypothetical protein
VNYLAPDSSDLAQFKDDTARQALHVRTASLDHLSNVYRRAWVFLIEAETDPSVGKFETTFPVLEEYEIEGHDRLTYRLYLLDLTAGQE